MARADANEGSKREAERQQLEWRVESRNKIQNLALDIFVFLKDEHGRLCNDTDSGSPVGRIVGAAFSLWRAVFLADNEHRWVPALEAGEEFLHQIVMHNSIGYMTEYDHRNWAFGFYINNAKHRIREICENANYSKLCLHLEAAGIGRLPYIGVTDLNPEQLWEDHFEALRITVEFLKAKFIETPLAPDIKAAARLNCSNVLPPSQSAVFDSPGDAFPLAPRPRHRARAFFVGATVTFGLFIGLATVWWMTLGSAH